MGTQTNIPPKFMFSPDFGHFIFKILDYAKMYTCQEKLLKYHKFLGDVPR